MNFLFSKDQVYKPIYRLYHYQDDVFRLVKFNCRQKGYENIKTKEENDAKFMKYIKSIMTDIYDNEKQRKQEESEKSSLSRTKRNIRELCLCNNFKYFVTLTVDSKHSDRFSLQQCQDLLKKLIHNYSRQMKYNNNEKFHYILITEKHKNGAFHFHGLFSDLIDKDIYINNNGYISSNYFNEKLGFCSFSRIKDILKCSNYITKYITKDCIKNEHNQIYMCSRGLSRAGVYDLPAQEVENASTLGNDFWTYKNDYCSIKDFHFDGLTDNEKVFLFTNYSKLK